MIRLILISLIFCIPMTTTFAQKERRMVREGVKDYQAEKFSEAEIQFRKALDEKPDLFEADYNIANSLYKQKKYEEAAKEYNDLLQKSEDPERKADLYHNLGNANLMAQQYEKGIDAFKNSLRIRPEDEDTRYNLAYAQSKLKEQQKQQQNDQNKDKKDKDQDKQKQDQQNKDQEEQKDQKDQQKQQQDQQEKKEDKKNEEQKGSEQKISKKDAEQMLNAVQNQEKEVKEKVDKKKAVAKPVRTEKDW